MDLSKKIIELVNLKKEGKTWDFKEKWYTSKALLLHDILNMANNETSKDSFIIIGVDENDDFSLVNVKDDPNRYNQNRLNNLLHSPKIKFAGDNIPIIKLETVNIYDCYIDVIIIKSTDNVPYYLVDNYVEKTLDNNGKKLEIIVHSSHIYIRRNDSNTPIDKCATVNEIERLWRKRFGIDLSVHEKFMKILSNKNEWEYYNDVYFHKYIPDFTFEILDKNDNNTYLPAPYSYEQYDKNQNTHILEVFFRNIKIDEYRVDYLDGSRLLYVYPNTEYISDSQNFNREVYSYLYFVKDDVRSKINNLFLDFTNSDHRYIFNIIKEYVIFFDSIEQKNVYNQYLVKNLNTILKESKKIAKDYSFIEVNKNLIKEKVIEDICQKKIITYIYNNNFKEK